MGVVVVVVSNLVDLTTYRGHLVGGFGVVRSHQGIRGFLVVEVFLDIGIVVFLLEVTLDVVRNITELLETVFLGTTVVVLRISVVLLDNILEANSEEVSIFLLVLSSNTASDNRDTSERVMRFDSDDPEITGS